MTIEDLCDPRRTIPAAFSGLQVHKVFRMGKTGRIARACDERIVNFDSLLIFKQRPENITCSICRMLEGDPRRSSK
jgi:hypothetical protein